MRHSAFWILATALVFFVARKTPSAEPLTPEDRAIEGAFFEYAKLAAKYGIEIELAKPPFPADGHVGGRSADPKKVATYLAVFKAEWSFYPTELVTTSGIKRVIFCEDLVSAQHGAVSGLAADGQDLYLDAGDRWNRSFSRRIIHHEYFHMIDYQMHLKVGVRHALPDKIWEGFNPAGFKYGPVPMVGSNSALNLTEKGFLSTYSRFAVQEDKAELYSYMVTMGQIVDNRAKLDPIIDAKAKRIKSLVKAFCPQMDDEFWKAARKVSRPGG